MSYLPRCHSTRGGGTGVLRSLCLSPPWEFPQAPPQLAELSMYLTLNDHPALPGTTRQAPHRSLRACLLLGTESGSNFREVSKMCAKPDAVCMAVSRFFQNPIQNNFSGIRNLHQNPLSRVRNPCAPSGYMRKQ